MSLWILSLLFCHQSPCHVLRFKKLSCCVDFRCIDPILQGEALIPPTHTTHTTHLPFCIPELLRSHRPAQTPALLGPRSCSLIRPDHREGYLTHLVWVLVYSSPRSTSLNIRGVSSLLKLYINSNRELKSRYKKYDNTLF